MSLEMHVQFAISALERAGKAFSDMSEAILTGVYRAAAKEYLKTHKRLPGSERTARLRKKRRTKVLAWAFSAKRAGI